MSRRLAVLVGIAVAAFAVGTVVGARHQSAGEKAARAFAAAWGHGDLAGMYRRLSPDARRRFGFASFRDAYARDALVATTRRLEIGRVDGGPGGMLRVAVTAATRVFGQLRGGVEVPASDGGVDWRPYMAFPGLRAGEALTRRTTLAPRAELLAREGTPLAKLPDIAGQVVGDLGPAPAQDAARLRALGYPDGAQVGTSGLQRFLQESLAGRPGGDLRAGGRVLAHTAPQPAAAIRTTISPAVERAAVSALAGRFGGVVAMRPRTGEILAFAGIAFSGLQPPGSTFKIITLTGALQARLATPRSTFAYATSTTLSGVQLGNANGESCGGTLARAFAVSCNSVFAPLGARLGAQRLVATAEAYGFNRPAGITGAATSSIPAAAEIGDDLAVGSSAIGQGRVQATTLQMARVASAVALAGRLPAVTLVRPARSRPAPTTRVTNARTARTVERLMRGVVRAGTGVRAAIDGAKVAGKTGTAELQSTAPCAPAAALPGQSTPANPESCQSSAGRTDDTDAWFTAYAPAGRPRIAVCVMLVRDGAGGDTAAPAARGVLLAGLRR